MYFYYHKMVVEIPKGKGDIAEFFPDTTALWWEKLALRGNEVKTSIFVNWSNINKRELDLSRIRLKYLRKLFIKFTVLWFKLMGQLYLRRVLQKNMTTC